MKRFLALFLTIVALLSLVACSASSEDTQPSTTAPEDTMLPGEAGFPETASQGLEYEINEDALSCTITGVGECTDLYISVGESIDGYPITAIANSAFYGNAELKGILLGENVVSVGDYAFFSCTGLETVILGENVSSLGQYAFAGCVRLSAIDIPEHLERIGAWAFYNCRKLASVTVDDLEHWCNIIFEGIYANPVMEAEQLYVDGELLTHLVLPESVTAVGEWSFAGCQSLTDVVLHENVTQIGQRAFMKCDGIKRFVYPGTREQWKELVLGTHWDFSIDRFVIECLDGEIKG